MVSPNTLLSLTPETGRALLSPQYWTTWVSTLGVKDPNGYANDSGWKPWLARLTRSWQTWKRAAASLSFLMSTWLTVWLAISFPAEDSVVSWPQVSFPEVPMLPLLT